MNYFSVTSPEQPIVIDKIKNCGGECIQVSNGLIVKTDKSKSELQAELGNATVAEIDRNDPDLSKDARLFIGIS